MKRREFVGLIGVTAVWPLAGRAQKSPVPVIGYLGFGSPEGYATRVAAFREGLQEAGYRDGENVAIEYRWAEGKNERLPALAADLARRQVAVIATPGSANAARAAKSVTTATPIVFETGADPIASGLVTSLSRPNGNVTGVTSLNVRVGQKRLEVLRHLLPMAGIVAALINPTNANAEAIIEDLQTAAPALGRQLNILQAGSEQDLELAFATLAQIRTDALVVSPDPFFIGRKERLVDLTVRHRVAAMFFSRDFAAAGGLISYGGSVTESHRQAGIYAGRILAGEKPANLPVMQVTKFELAINLRTARALGLTVPQTLLVTADEVIE
jgi:putative tryptophan/tyrosine transport system substrate-binding protein